MNEATTIQIKRKGDEADIMIPDAAKYAEVDPSRILIQILRRPSDPITERLLQNATAWTVAGFGLQYLKDPFMGWVDVARNWQSRMFRNAKQFDYVMIVDQDVGPPPMAPLLLARHKLPVVSACVPAWTSERGIFLCIAVKGPDGIARFPSFNHVKSMPSHGLVEIHNCGTGCLMIRRDVIEQLWLKYEADQKELEQARAALIDILADEKPDKAKVKYLLNRLNYEEDNTGAPFSIPQSVRDKGAVAGQMPRGEDICFTDRTRQGGFKIYADLEVQCYHEKMMALLWPVDAVDHEMSVDDWAASAFTPPTQVI